MCLAIPGRIVAVSDLERRLATVEIAGVRRKVDVGLLEDGRGVAVGDWVLIHVGFAISRVDEEEARATLELLEGLGAEYRQEVAEIRAGAVK